MRSRKVVKSLNYIEQIEEALYALQRKDADELKTKFKFDDNELIIHLVELLEDKDVRFSDVELPKPVPKNDGRQRLSNYLLFVKFAEKLKNKKANPDKEAVKYIFGNFDESEQAVYKLILTHVSKPKEKERAKKEKTEEQAE